MTEEFQLIDSNVHLLKNTFGSHLDEEYLKLYKLNDWILVDFDFGMKGNKLVYGENQ